MHNFYIFLMLLGVMQITNPNDAYADSDKPVIAVIIALDQNKDALKLDSDNLSLIYWGKQRYWPEGLRIKPVNLRAQHPLRLLFSQSILGSPPSEQIDYWNGQYFNGILPPHSVNSEEAVIRYITQTKGAIGYVDACTVDARIQAIFWLTPNGRVLTIPPLHLDCTK